MLLFLASNIKIFLYLLDDFIINRLRFLNIKSKHFLINPIKVFNTLYKLIPHTRDIVNGKGEYTLTYMMIYVWWNYYPHLAEYALYNCLVLDVNETPTLENKHPYGSWKDVKYFCNYILKKSKNKKHPLIEYCLQVCNTHISFDIRCLESTDNKSNVSLLGKWFPRESSKKFGWLFKLLAVKRYNYIKFSD